MDTDLMDTLCCTGISAGLISVLTYPVDVKHTLVC